MLGAGDARVIGVSDGADARTLAGNVARLLNAAAEVLGLSVRAASEDFAVYDEYGPGGYGVVTKEVVETIAHVARTEGVPLDPIYTAKAMYGLVDLAHRGSWRGVVPSYSYTQAGSRHYSSTPRR